MRRHLEPGKADFVPAGPSSHLAARRLESLPVRIAAIAFVALMMMLVRDVGGLFGPAQYSTGWTSTGIGGLLALLFTAAIFWICRREIRRFRAMNDLPSAEHERSARGTLSDPSATDDLWQSRDLLRLLLDNIPLGVFWKDRDSRYLGCNQFMAHAVGLERSENIVGLFTHELPSITTAEAADQEQQDRTVIEKDFEQKHLIERVTRADGTTAWHETCRIPIHGSHGQVIGLMGTWSDITARRQTEAALRVSEATLRLFIEHVPAPIAMFDREMRYLHVSRRWFTDFQLENSNLIGLRHYDVFPNLPERWKEIHRRCLAGATEQQSEDFLKRSDGTTQWIRWEVCHWKQADGAIGGIMIFAEEITEKRKARIDQDKLVKIIEHSSDFIAMADLNGRLTFMNAGGRRMIGLADQQDLDTLSFYDYIPTNWQEFFRKTVIPTALAEGIWEGEMQLRNIETGALIDVFRTKFLVTDPTGERWFATVTRDITELKRKETAIRESEERYRRLVNVLPGALYVHNGKEILFCNQAFVRLMGATSADELLGRNPFTIAHPDFHTMIRQRLATIKEFGGIAPAMEMLAVRLDGHAVPVNVIGTSITGYGQPAFLVSLSDLTERDRTLGLLRSVMESVNDAILTIDLSGTVRSANSATERMFGYRVHEVINQTVDLLMPEAFPGEPDESLPNQIPIASTNAIGSGREVVGRRKDGSTFPIELSITEFQLDRRRHFTGVLRDTTTRKRLESQLQQAQKMEAVGRLAGGVAHDFNNLLTVINGYSQLMLNELPSDSDQRELVDAILEAGERAAHLTQQLLAFSRKAVIEPQILNLNEIVDKSSLMLRRLIEEDVLLTVAASAEEPYFKAAPGQIEQVLMNIIVNARDAMPCGGRIKIGTENVTLAAHETLTFPNLRSGTYVQLTVSDTGHGMSEDIKGKIFEPFFTTKDVGKGTGLGLSVVHGVVQQCDGAISVESQVGAGTTFTLMFPVVETPTRADDASTPPQVPHGSETVLLVEDAVAVRKIACLALQAHGYNVIEASDGKAALQLAEQYPNTIELLLTDVVMPEIGGVKLAEALKLVRPEMRVLYMSGYTDDAVLQRGVNNAHVTLLQKPFTAVALARKVRSVLDSLP